MKTSRRTHQGFTLIEIMAVVSIIGILGSLAIANYRAQLLKSRVTEREQLMGTLGRAARLYVDEGGIVPSSTGTGTFLADWNPVATPRGAPMPFDRRKAGWTALAFGTESGIRFGLRVQATKTASQTTLVIQNRGDVDQDGLVATQTQTWVLDSSGWRKISETTSGDNL